MTLNRDYFKDNVQWDGKSDYEPFFVNTNNLAFLEAAEGIRLHPVFGEKLMLSYVTFAANSVAPVHQHPQEQLTMVLQGGLEFEVGGLTQVMKAGDVVAIPSGVPHGATALAQGCVAIDVFAPPRDGFKNLMQDLEAARQ